MTTRENGHYWVKVVDPRWNPGFRGEWEVAKWDAQTASWRFADDEGYTPDGPYMRVVEDRLVLPCAAARMDLVDEIEAARPLADIRADLAGTITTNQLNPPMDPVQPDGQ